MFKLQGPHLGPLLPLAVAVLRVEGAHMSSGHQVKGMLMGMSPSQSVALS